MGLATHTLQHTGTGYPYITHGTGYPYITTQHTDIEDTYDDNVLGSLTPTG